MLWLWIVLAIIVVLIGSYILLVWQTVQHSIAVSKLLIAKGSAYTQHPQHPTIRILVAGESTAVGVGATNTQNSIPGRIGMQYPNTDITNIAVSGARLVDLLNQLYEHTGERYGLVLLMIGANDITHLTPYDAIRTRLSHALAQADQMGERVIMLTSGDVGLSPAFKWPVSLLMDRRTRAVRRIFIEEVAMHPNGTYVDLFHEAHDEIFNTNISRYYAADYFHPSDDGYGVWYEQLRGVLDVYLKAKQV